MRFVSAPLCLLLGTVWMAWCGAGTVLQAAEAGDADHAIVPGFERFFAPAESELNPAQGGDLLLGELNCTSCHQAEKSHETYVIKKQAPVLDQVGTRVRVGWLRKYLTDPQSIKPGTTMPAVFAGLSEQERRDQVEALVHFLASTGTVAHKAAEPNHVANGQKLYHTVGCVACHGPRNDDKAPRLPDSMPLGDLRSKYTIPALTAFLQDPLKYRPSGRMPSLTLKIDELRDITNYLLPDAKYQILNPNLHYAYYEGDWQNLPDFSKLKPEAQGEVAGFDMGVARRQNNMALKFDGFLKIEKDGDYNFIATSDDGSKVWIDGKQVVDNDGIHAPSTKDGRTHLTAGMHEFTAAVFNGGGGVELAIEMEGSGLPRQPVAPSLFLNRDGKRPEVKTDDSDPDALVLNQDLVAKGRNLFASAGCASCHALHVENQPIASTIKALELAKVKPGAGCLSDAAATGRPQYKLSAAEKKAITAALPAFAQPRPAIEVPEQIARTMLSLNCYACHQRGELGGVTPERTSFFETTQKEMGDEGRIPPPLNGVGAKIVHGYLKNIVSNGSKDRPYMLTRMPKFGERNVGKLADDFSAVDKIEPVETPKFDEPIRHVKASGRFMVGDKAFSCIKCHNFRGIQSTGIQAIDLTILAKRLNHDWFHRYMINPQEFRPGTRMPAAWPFGQSQLKTVFDGNTEKQIEAIWLYLSDGEKAPVPEGLARSQMELVADKEAVIYRNFIDGAGPRAIGVGYPEKANIAFDANDMRLALIWQGKFIDASRHWTGRGEGYQQPLGDNVLSLPTGPSFATLNSTGDAWPNQPARTIGFKFHGYKLDKEQRPTFLYDFGPVNIEDSSTGVKAKDGKMPELKRTITLTSPSPPPDLYFRAMVANKIEPRGTGWYEINGEWKLRILTSTPPVIRDSNGKKELLFHVKFKDNKAHIVEEFEW